MFRNRILIVLISLITSQWAVGQRHLELPLYPDSVAYGDYREAKVQVFLPQKSNGTAVIACPGGGYAYLALKKEGTGFSDYFNKRGIALIVLEYRLPRGRYMTPFSDALKAIGLVQKNAKKWQIDPSKIGIMGASAGGHLASTLATHATGTARPAFQILLYPVISMQDSLTHADSRQSLLGADPTPELVRYFSNEEQVNSETPPAFIVLSGDDGTVSPLNSIRYYQALHAHKVSSELVVFPTGGHGWAGNDSFLYKDDWLHSLDKWINMTTASIK